MRFGESLDCPIDNTSILVQCLKRMDGRRIVKKHASILSPIHTQDDFFPGSVEAVQREDTFLSENPFMMVQRGDFNRIPVIFGMNSGEGALKTASTVNLQHLCSTYFPLINLNYLWYFGCFYLWFFCRTGGYS